MQSVTKGLFGCKLLLHKQHPTIMLAMSLRLAQVFSRTRDFINCLGQGFRFLCKDATSFGGWVGQTFALARCNDSGGKKSRIRRSKVERKSLVESFIKKHQKLNNGSFPSLNLTHKEVGGSFYTVREIVREVIQENKVLGPGNPDDILEQHLIGSFSIEHQSDSFSTNGPSANVEGLENEHHSLGDGAYLNKSSEIFQKNEEHERAKVVVSEDREILVLEEGVEDTQASSAKVTTLEAALSVKTSPLTSGSEKSFGLDDKNSVLNDKSGEKERQSSVVDGMNFLENVSDLRNEQASLDFVDKNLVGKVEVLVEDNLVTHMAKEGTDIFLNHHQNGSEEPDLNANTQGLQYEHQSFDEGLEISGLGKASEKKEKHEDLSIGYGDREITEPEEKSSNGSVLNKSLEKGGESSVEEPLLNANTQGIEHEHQKFGERLQISGLGTAFEKNEEHENMCIKILELQEKTSNGSILNENLGKGELDSSVLDEKNFQQSASDLIEAKKIANIAVQRLENCRDLLIETEDKDASVVGIEIADQVNGVNTLSSKDAKIASSKQTTPKAAIATQSNPNNRLVEDLKGTNPTLDRMNLESWKTTSDKHQEMPTNLLSVYFKAFITAFVNFWS